MGVVNTERVRVVTVTRGDDTLRASDVSFREALAAAAPLTESVSVSGDDLFILLYTSGTAGHPKGVEVPVRALAAFEAYIASGWTCGRTMCSGTWPTQVGPMGCTTGWSVLSFGEHDDDGECAI